MDAVFAHSSLGRGDDGGKGTVHTRLWRIAHVCARGWWGLWRPQAVGASVALIVEGRILAVRPSYRPLWDTPGGGLRRGEDPARGAVRELAEETGVVVDPARLRARATLRFVQEGRWITHHLFELRLAGRPAVRARAGEIAQVAWLGARDRPGPLSPVLGWCLRRLLDEDTRTHGHAETWIVVHGDPC